MATNLGHGHLVDALLVLQPVQPFEERSHVRIHRRRYGLAMDDYVGIEQGFQKAASGTIAGNSGKRAWTK
ncbi:MAG TPA: hypothetical protein P5291_00905 [Flavobacteriales bacterium]|nr:hypothetical protein [Flavobacteriales bacterium]